MPDRAPACALFDRPDVRVLSVEHSPVATTPTIETAPGPVERPGCGVVAAVHGRREHRLHERARIRHSGATGVAEASFA
ncbi:hypothetical protein [Kocuria nitroreducens]|uniref:hypothetical protein n=1 Tax=Kocuria nitroreducens TaxID=3058914 RepID=UPI0036DCC40C